MFHLRAKIILSRTQSAYTKWKQLNFIRTQKDINIRTKTRKEKVKTPRDLSTNRITKMRANTKKFYFVVAHYSEGEENQIMSSLIRRPWSRLWKVKTQQRLAVWWTNSPIEASPHHLIAIITQWTMMVVHVLWCAVKIPNWQIIHFQFIKRIVAGM